MSEYKVPLTTIKEIYPHNNAHSLEIAVVYGFQVVIQKDKYKVGDAVLYVPIDSVLPKKIETFLFPEGTKIKLHKSRIKQIRIRNFASQGLLVSQEDVKTILECKTLPPLETDLAPILGIFKYEPPVPEYLLKRKLGGSRNKPLENPLFHKYNGIDNIKWFPNLFTEDEDVVITEKLHGTNCRVSMLPTTAPSLKDLTSLLKRIPSSYDKLSDFKSSLSMAKRIILGKLNLLPKYEYCYGSNNVELTNRIGYSGYYGEDIYGNVLRKIKAFEKLKPNEIVYGEIIGAGIQKNYDYGHKDEHHFVMFDVKIVNNDGTFTWHNPEEAKEYAEERGFDFVPVLYEGEFNKELAYELTKGASVYCPEQKIKEGVVIKSTNYNDLSMTAGKRSLKYISEAYLDKDNSDFH